MKDISCPHCKETVVFSLRGFEHDADLNFICTYCKKPIFATTAEAEDRIKKVIPPSYQMGFQYNKKEPLPISIGPTDQTASKDEPPTLDQIGMCFC